MKAEYKPSGDQPKAIEGLVRGLNEGMKKQTLLGVTGSGKSLVADTPMFVKKNNKMLVEPIGKCIDDFFDAHPQRIVKKNDTMVIELSRDDDSIEAYSFDPLTKKVSWKKVTQLVRHESPRTLFHVETTCGRTVTVTGDHNFFVLREGYLQLVETDTIQSGDYIPLPLRIPAPKQPLKALHLLDFVDSKKKRYISVPAFPVLWKKHQKTLRRFLSPAQLHHVLVTSGRMNETLFLTLIKRFPSLAKGATFGGKIKKYQVPFRYPVTNDLLQLLGYYIAEGHAEKTYVTISAGDKEVVNDITRITYVLGLRCHYRPGTYDYQVNSSLWSSLFAIWCGSHSYNKRLPSFWTQLSNTQLGVLLRAYFSGDGGVNGRQVTCATISHTLASDIVYALLRFGIVARTSKRTAKIPNKNITREYWQVSIAGKQSLETFAKEIGFSIDRKTVKLQSIISSVYNTNVDLIPLQDRLKNFRTTFGFSQKMLARACGVERSFISLIEHGKRLPSRLTFQKMISYLGADKSLTQDQECRKEVIDMKSYLGLYWTKIKKITKVRGETYVYDIAVEDHETFLAGYGGLFVHNTFTVANAIAETNRPTLVIAHNKTLAAQLCNEFREFFPDNAVEYFVSYYDYYQPEAYMPHSDTYIEKEAQINEEIDRLRHACTQALLSRRDVIIVASVSAIYGLGSPKEYEKIVVHLRKGEDLDRRGLTEQLIGLQFERTTADLKRGSFRLQGQVFEIMPVNDEKIYRFEISNRIDRIEYVDPVTRKVIREVEDAWFFPAKHYVAGPEARERAFTSIKEELQQQLDAFQKKGKVLEYERLKRRVAYDLEMIKNIGFCNGIENYSRHFDGRNPGEPPFTLLDYFYECSPDFLTVIDESHVTVPQIRGMYAGDRARKDTLVEHGFRLPSARDNRPLQYDEFEKRVAQTIYVSATPTEFELKESEQVVEQIVRPTGLVDPEVLIRPVTGNAEHKSQVEDVIERIQERVAKGERALVTTLTKKMAEDLSEHLRTTGLKVKYLHSDIDTLERVQILMALRTGEVEVIVGVNLLREGLDLPEVSLVAILDADKEGFLRSETSLIQTIGRAARNVNGLVVLYADHMTGSIERALKETSRRREIQLAYNEKHGITPKTIQKRIRNILEEFGISADAISEKKMGRGKRRGHSIADLDTMGDARPLKEILKEKEEQMREAAQKLEFELAALLRDEIRELRAKDSAGSTAKAGRARTKKKKV